VLPGVAARSRARILLSPANLAPLAWPRNVVVMHDAAALAHPEWYSREYAAWQRTILPALARAAVLVITVSSFSRDEIVELMGASRERVAVVHGGVDERFSPTADAAAAARALGLERPYVLTVGSLTARKNLVGLEPAAWALAARGVELVAAGGGRPQLRAEAGPGGVRALGHVDDELLPGLYAGARAFVLASRHEGFGLTCLEAMASGVPVVAADRGALPETTGGAALLVDPADTAHITSALEQALDDEALRERLVTAGVARAATLTWDRAAREVDALLAALGG
jgi:glycosyltransferase involved in cell wall biosynthesis